MSILAILVAILYAFRLFVPYVNSHISLPINLLMCAFLLFFFIQKIKGGYKVFINRILLLFLVLFFFQVIMLQNSADIFQSTYALLILLPAVILSFYSMDGKKNMKLNKWLFYSLLGGIIITSYTTYIGCLTYPSISRQLAMDNVDLEIRQMSANLNIGGFETIYIMVLMLPLWVVLLKNKGIGFYTRLLAFGVLLSSLLAIIQSEYTTAILFALLALCTFILPPDISFKSFMRIFLACLVFFLLFTVFLVPIFELLAENIESSSVKDRLYDIIAVIQGKDIDNESDANIRFTLFLNSIEAFAESPLWGNFKITGGHSALGNILSFYGLIGLYMLYFLLKRMFKLFIKPFLNQGIDVALYFVCITYIMFLVLNPQLYLIVPLFLVPTCAKYIIILSNKTIIK